MGATYGKVPIRLQCADWRLVLLGRDLVWLPKKSQIT